MKHARKLAAGAMVAALFALALSCAQPPKAEIDAARAKVGAAQKDADIVAYAPGTLQQAKDSLARMEKFLSDKKYTETKAAATQAAALADQAKAEVAGAKEKIKNEAASLIADAKKALSGLQPTIALAKKVRPAGLDLNSLDTQLNSAKTKLSEADTAFGGGKFKDARDAASAAKASFSDIEKRIADAIQASRKKK
ncbi:MAG: DUF4398 domain-containing protein [Rectinemataceae bacterium]